MSENWEHGIVVNKKDSAGPTCRFLCNKYMEAILLTCLSVLLVAMSNYSEVMEKSIFGFFHLVASLLRPIHHPSIEKQLSFNVFFCIGREGGRLCPLIIASSICCSQNNILSPRCQAFRWIICFQHNAYTIISSSLHKASSNTKRRLRRFELLRFMTPLFLSIHPDYACSNLYKKLLLFKDCFFIR